MNKIQVRNRMSFMVIMFALVISVISILLVSKPILRAVYPLKYDNLISEYSAIYGLDKYMVMGIISAESKFEETAVSHKNARGLMQIKDETFDWCAKMFDIDTNGDFNEMNINVGCAYIRYLTDKFAGNKKTVLAAYNAGEGNVTKWLGEQGSSEDLSLSEIPYTETEKYVETVEKRQKIYRYLYN